MEDVLETERDAPEMLSCGDISSTTLLMVASVMEAAARSASAADVRATTGVGTTDWKEGRACTEEEKDTGFKSDRFQDRFHDRFHDRCQVREVLPHEARCFGQRHVSR